MSRVPITARPSSSLITYERTTAAKKYLKTSYRPQARASMRLTMR